jgi:Leucine-rich repeat (LRR) protein
LQKIHINKSKITDDSLALLSSLPSMESLYLQQNHFSDKGLERLRRKSRLKKLCVGFGNPEITDMGLLHLKNCTKLELLDLQSCNITDRGLEVLKGLPSLNTLWLSGTKVTRAQIKSLRQALPRLNVTQ